MNIWKSNIWKKDIELCTHIRRNSLRLRFEKDINLEVRRACTQFARWLRREFYFPIRVTIYFKNNPIIIARDGQHVSATFLRPSSKDDEPYIKIATGDYQELFIKWGKDNALAAILGTISHELTHYFQWLNNINLTEIGEERQAINYGYKIVYEYSQTREHP